MSVVAKIFVRFACIYIYNPTKLKFLDPPLSLLTAQGEQVLTAVCLLHSTVVINHHILVTDGNSDVIAHGNRDIINLKTSFSVICIPWQSVGIQVEIIIDVVYLGSI